MPPMDNRHSLVLNVLHSMPNTRPSQAFQSLVELDSTSIQMLKVHMQPDAFRAKQNASGYFYVNGRHHKQVPMGQGYFDIVTSGPHQNIQYMGPFETATPAGPAVVYSAPKHQSIPQTSLSSSTERKLSPERRNSAPQPPVSVPEIPKAATLVRNHSDPFKITSNNLSLISEPVPSSLTESQMIPLPEQHSLSLGSNPIDDDTEAPYFLPESILNDVLPIEIHTKPTKSNLSSSPIHLSPRNSFVPLIDPKGETSLAEAVSSAGSKVESAVSLLSKSKEMQELPKAEQVSISTILVGILSELQQIRYQMERQTAILSKPIQTSHA